MSKDLQPIPPTGIQPTPENRTLNFGQVDTFVAHTDKVTTNVFFGGTGLPVDQAAYNAGLPPKMNTAFYNLFVVSNEAISQTGFYILKKDALQDTDDDVVTHLIEFGESEIAAVRSFPTVVATQNHRCGATDATHQAAYGFINSIQMKDNTIQFGFTKLQDVPQCLLIEEAATLGIGRASAYNEFDRPHWAVKRINIVEALRNRGVQLVVLSY